MSEPTKGRPRLTLRDLEALDVPAAATALPPRRTTGALEAVPDTVPRPATGSLPALGSPAAPDPERTALLSRAAREQAAREQAAREEEERQRQLAADEAARQAREAAERERLAMEAALAQAQARQAAEEAARARQLRLVAVLFTTVVVALLAVVLVLALRPPDLDPTPWSVSQAATGVPAVPEVELSMREIPAPPVPAENAESIRPSRTGPARTGPQRPPSIRRSDLF
jgi:hypothetical protein